MKNVVILGSTGSVGVNALKVLSRFPKQFRLLGMSAFHNLDLLTQQVKAFKPRYVALAAEHILEFKRKVSSRSLKILQAPEDLADLAALKTADIVILAIGGSAALLPFLSAVKAGKRVAPANKEALVMAGHLIRKEMKRSGAEIIPVDSEQSAIFQCLSDSSRKFLRKIFLTASGGALYNVPASRFRRLSINDVLNHPRWQMGRKITVDSATLMNKGLEVIEARWLFDVPINKIDVLIHREAVIHSMVEFCDGSILAQLGIPDMRLPIQYALTYPQRRPSALPAADFLALKQLTFNQPDLCKFPCLRLAIEAGCSSGTAPTVLNAANEVAVAGFLDERWSFIRIPQIVERVLGAHRSRQDPNLKEILAADAWAREEAWRRA